MIRPVPNVSCFKLNLRIFHRMKPLVSLLFLLSPFVPSELKAQYYYKDILISQYNLEQFKLAKTAKVTRVNLQSFEADGRPTEDFICNQTYNNTYSQVKTYSNAPITGESLLTAYYNFQGLIYKSVDSSKESAVVYDYKFDSTGRLSSIGTSSAGYGDKVRETEDHQWFYNSKGQPERMLKVKNGNDTSIVKFTYDEKGNIAEEESFWRNSSQDKVYYYYDDKNRMTDVVRYNARARKLLPDYMFEYDGENRLSQMVNVQGGGIDYFTWQYTYNEKGLKAKETCSNKQKQLIGRVEYQYEYKK